jgi:N-acyl-D-aspartate/D-glutamate deacylase
MVVEHDLVISGGRVIDPETGVDGIANVGVTGARITEVSDECLAGRFVLDVAGNVVCPGFVDLHSHGQAIAEQRLQALDGVTSALELEAGAHPVEAAYARAAAEGRPIHYGFSASWALARMAVLTTLRSSGGVREFLAHIADGAWQRVATTAEVARVVDLLGSDLAAGALGIGVLVGYAPRTAVEEYLSVVRAAAGAGVPTYTHARDLVEVDPDTVIDGATEIVQAAVETGAHMHYCHINSTSTRHVDRVLGLVARVRTEGAKVTTEAYPYGTGMTGIGAAFLAPERLAQRGLTPRSIRYVRTGRQVANAAELVELRRRDPGGLAFVEFLRDDDSADFAWIERAIGSPGTVVASDAMPLHWPDVPPDPYTWPLPAGTVAHPRTAGTFARTLRLVRERGLMSLPDAVARCTLLPARVIESAAPAMRRKARIQPGCDADIVVFDPERVSDQATYTDTIRPSTGIVHVLVNGTFVVRDAGLIPDALPGRPLRAEPS